MPDIHLLTPPGGDLRTVTVACRARLPERGSWDRRVVTCAACLAPPPARVSRSGTLTEKQWLAQVRQYARAQEWMTYHTLHSVGSEPGWIDLVCLRPPVLVLAELKAAGGRLTPHQLQWLTGLRQVERVSTHLWYPADWGEVETVLR